MYYTLDPAYILYWTKIALIFGAFLAFGISAVVVALFWIANELHVWLPKIAAALDTIGGILLRFVDDEEKRYPAYPFDLVERGRVYDDDEIDDLIDKIVMESE